MAQWPQNRIGLRGAIVALLVSAPALAVEIADGPGDWELATVVITKDRALEVEHKLGVSPCVLPSSSREAISFLYNVHGENGLNFLRVEVDGNNVDQITISKDPPIAGVCYAPAHLTGPVQTGKGLRLGATEEEVVRLYGKPTESFSVGPMTRYRYEAMYTQLYEWDLVFRNGHLVEWTVATDD